MGTTDPRIAYSARRVDLYTPSGGAQFFSGGKPPSEAALCPPINYVLPVMAVRE